MKQNMCVTIDAEVYSWLKSKPGKLSSAVNRILLDKMIEEKIVKSEYYHYSCLHCTYEGEYNRRSQYHHCPRCLEDKGQTEWLVEGN